MPSCRIPVSHRMRSYHVLPLIMLAAALMLASGPARPSAAQGTAKKEKLKPIAPEDITLETKDGVQLHCTYFPGGVMQTSGEPGRESYEKVPGNQVIPILLLHGAGENRGIYEPFAKFLQLLGHAVIVPDLRGHGDSTVRHLPNGREAEIDRAKMRPVEYESMMNDLIAVKKFIQKENNEEKLNQEMLCIVGSDMGASLAMIFAVYDWARPTLPAYKAGRDVKALVLISPDQTTKGLKISAALTNPVVGGRLPVLIASGEEDRKSFSEARTIFDRLKRLRPGASDKAEVTQENQTLFLIPLATSLQGTKLLYTQGLRPLHQDIAMFVKTHVAAHAEQLKWTKRENPLGDDS